MSKTEKNIKTKQEVPTNILINMVPGYSMVLELSNDWKGLLRIGIVFAETQFRFLLLEQEYIFYILVPD